MKEEHLISLTDKLIADLRAIDSEENKDRTIKTTALVVDDDPNIASLMEKLLMSHDVFVNTAHTGSAAIEMIKNLQYHLVFLDLHLPDIDGIAVLKRIRELQPGTRVIIISLYPEMMACIPTDQFVGYCAKPFSSQIVDEILQKYKLIRK